MALTLRTPRLILREWRDDDVEPFVAMSNDPEVMRYLPAPDPEWIGRQQRHFAEHGYGQWVVELPDQVSFMGVVGLSRVRFPTPFTPAIEVAWRLKRSNWGWGYAFEAARAAIEDCFCRIGLSEIVAFTVPANTASWRLMERLGMNRNPAEEFDHPRFAEDHPLRRHVLYRLAAT